MSMTDDTFASLVAEEVKGKVSATQRQYLLLPENANRWRDALVSLSRSLQEQLNRLAEREETEGATYQTMGADGVRLLAELLADIEMRRKRINRFKFFVDQRLDEVTRSLEMDGERVSEREGIVEFLRLAIEAHHTMMTENDMEETPIDRALWAALDGRWEFDKVKPEDLAHLATDDDDE